MCDFIFVGLPAKQAEAARAILPSGLFLSASRNPDLIARLPCTHSAFWLTTGMCSCGLWPLVPAALRPEAFRRKGWSETKARRAYEDALHLLESRAARQPPNLMVLWLRRVVTELKGPVFLHEARYSGNQDEQHPHIGDTVDVTVAPGLEPLLRRSAFNRVDREKGAA